ncbi:MAG: flagellar basal-body rod protein FlgF [Magnetospiraceae bacterium]
MENTLYIALSRQSVLRREMGVIATNIANMNTNGYQAERMMFVDHLERSRGNEHLLPDKLSFVRDIKQYRSLDEGPLETTGNPLDVAIAGRGYFSIQTDDGPRYTRDGRFTLDASGTLVNGAGLPVLSVAGGPLQVGPEDTSLMIANDGTLSSEAGVIGRIGVYEFDNEQALEKQAGNLFDAGEQPANEATAPRVQQGALEGSNVVPVVELTRMIEVQRAYESTKSFVEEEHKRQKSVYSLMTAARSA